ncbi:hypothetical protein [Moorena sp. SIO3F7]|nr:hypothetical protein [Moorena sp. SIO3F7]
MGCSQRAAMGTQRNWTDYTIKVGYRIRKIPDYSIRAIAQPSHQP